MLTISKWTRLFLVGMSLLLFWGMAKAGETSVQSAKKPLSRGEIIGSLQRMAEGKEEIVFNRALEDMVDLLSRTNDKELCLEFYRFLLVFKLNGLDGEVAEAIPYFFGEIFSNNPELIERTLKEYPNTPLPAESTVDAKTERQFLFSILEWGWEDFLQGKDKNDPRIRDKSKRLQALKSLLFHGDKEE